MVSRWIISSCEQFLPTGSTDECCPGQIDRHFPEIQGLKPSVAPPDKAERLGIHEKFMASMSKTTVTSSGRGVASFGFTARARDARRRIAARNLLLAGGPETAVGPVWRAGKRGLTAKQIQVPVEFFGSGFIGEGGREIVTWTKPPLQSGRLPACPPRGSSPGRPRPPRRLPPMGRGRR
jgi:hypothetical protein